MNTWDRIVARAPGCATAATMLAQEIEGLIADVERREIDAVQFGIELRGMIGPVVEDAWRVRERAS